MINRAAAGPRAFPQWEGGFHRQTPAENLVLLSCLLLELNREPSYVHDVQEEEYEALSPTSGMPSFSPTQNGYVWPGVGGSPQHFRSDYCWGQRGITRA